MSAFDDNMIPDEISWVYQPFEQELSGEDRESSHPFWSSLEALAWIVSGRERFADQIGTIVREKYGEVHPLAALGQLLLITSKHYCFCDSQNTEHDIHECGIYDGPTTFWRDCSCVEGAGKRLLTAIRDGVVVPIDKELKAPIPYARFVSFDASNNCSGWLDLGFQPLFDRIELINAFPSGGASREAKAETISTIAAQSGCAKFLIKAFEKDAEKKLKKLDFWEKARARFGSKLSRRGFNRAWDQVAPVAGRSKPGRKS